MFKRIAHISGCCSPVYACVADALVLLHVNLWLLFAGASCNLTQQIRNTQKLAALEFSNEYLSHDHGKGAPKEAVEAFAGSLSV